MRSIHLNRETCLSISSSRQTTLQVSHLWTTVSILSSVSRWLTKGLVWIQPQSVKTLFSPFKQRKISRWTKRTTTAWSIWRICCNITTSVRLRSINWRWYMRDRVSYQVPSTLTTDSSLACHLIAILNLRGYPIWWWYLLIAAGEAPIMILNNRKSYLPERIVPKLITMR